MNMVLLDKAICIATTQHYMGPRKNKFDKGGKPYITHPMRLLHKAMQAYPNDEEFYCIVVMHDVIEDTHYTLEMLEEEFPPRVVEGVRLMTKEDGISNDDYIERGLDNYDFVRCKILDTTDNLDPTRLKGITDKDHARTAKYHTNLMKLYAALENNFRILEVKNLLLTKEELTNKVQSGGVELPEGWSDKKIEKRTS